MRLRCGDQVSAVRTAQPCGEKFSKNLITGAPFLVVTKMGRSPQPTRLSVGGSILVLCSRQNRLGKLLSPGVWVTRSSCSMLSIGRGSMGLPGASRDLLGRTPQEVHIHPLSQPCLVKKCAFAEAKTMCGIIIGLWVLVKLTVINSSGRGWGVVVSTTPPPPHSRHSGGRSARLLAVVWANWRSWLSRKDDPPLLDAA